MHLEKPPPENERLVDALAGIDLYVTEVATTTRRAGACRPTVVPIRKPEIVTDYEPPLTATELRQLRKMLAQFAHLKTACPTMRRELDE